MYIETSDFEFVNTTKELKIKYYFDQYPQVYAEKISLISFIDPCLTPQDLTGTNNRDEIGGTDGYAFDGSTITWDQTPALETSTPFCPVTWSCVPLIAPENFLEYYADDCNVPGLMSFDTTTGHIDFSATLDDWELLTQRSIFKYEFKITAEIGKAEAKVKFFANTFIKMQNLCETD